MTAPHQLTSQFIPLFNMNGESTMILGFAMNQNRLAVPTWSWAMEKYQPVRILELGSYNGGLATALGVHAWNLGRHAPDGIGCKVITYDRMVAPDQRFAPLSAFLGIEFRQCDLYAPETVAEIIELVRSPGRTFLLCDGGDKKLEVNTYAPHLKPGDVIAGHDYNALAYAAEIPDAEKWWPWTELRKDDVAEIVTAAGLVPFHQEHFDLAGWLAYTKP